MNAQVPTGDAALTEALLSIDVDAELAKLLERSFRSPQHYPVELVRAALARGASQVQIRLDRNTLVVEDDGRAMSRVGIDALARVLDRAAADNTRQEALALLEEAGEGLLACLVPSPTRIEIGSRDDQGGWRVTVRGGVVRLEELAAGPAQNSLRLQRRSAHAEHEREVLRRYCRYSPARIELDGQRIGRDLPKVLASTRLNDGTQVMVPWEGQLSRLLRLHHGIRADLKMGRDPQGLVYEAVLEGNSGWPGDLTLRAATATRQLYGDLVRRYPQASPEQQQRTEELLFRLHRISDAAELLADLPAFCLLGKARRLTLPEVETEAQAGRLFALSVDDRTGRYDLRGIEVLWLSPRQREFLAEVVGLVLPTPLRAARRTSALRRLGVQASEWLRARLQRRPSGPCLAIEDPLLLGGERELLIAIRAALRRDGFRLPGLAATSSPRVFMTERRSARASALLPERAGENSGLVLFRHHRLTRQAVLALARDPNNLDFILPALLDGQDGWTH